MISHLLSISSNGENFFNVKHTANCSNNRLTGKTSSSMYNYLLVFRIHFFYPPHTIIPYRHIEYYSNACKIVIVSLEVILFKLYNLNVIALRRVLNV